MIEKRIKLTFTEPLLGTAAADPKLHERYIASLAPDAESRAEEVARLGADEVAERALTRFADATEGGPMLWDYQVRGHLKEQVGILKNTDGSGLSAERGKKLWRAHKKLVDNSVFIAEREIPLHLPEGRGLGVLERPLRASTPQGERIALAASETAPAGTWIEFTLVLARADLWDGIAEALDYGRWKGIGQWRNAGYGRYAWELVEG